MDYAKEYDRMVEQSNSQQETIQQLREQLEAVAREREALRESQMRFADQLTTVTKERDELAALLEEAVLRGPIGGENWCDRVVEALAKVGADKTGEGS